MLCRTAALRDLLDAAKYQQEASERDGIPVPLCAGRGLRNYQRMSGARAGWTKPFSPGTANPTATSPGVGRTISLAQAVARAEQLIEAGIACGEAVTFIGFPEAATAAAVFCAGTQYLGYPLAQKVTALRSYLEQLLAKYAS